jgi:hypothetical protein
MHRYLLPFTVIATILATGSLASRVEAFPVDGDIAARLANESSSPLKTVAICFYVDGLNGPGLYDCGFRYRRGHGWHGRRDADNRGRREFDRNHRRGDDNGHGDKNRRAYR